MQVDLLRSTPYFETHQKKPNSKAVGESSRWRMKSLTTVVMKAVRESSRFTM